jgi:hypothetical protein
MTLRKSWKNNCSSFHFSISFLPISHIALPYLLVFSILSPFFPFLSPSPLHYNGSLTPVLPFFQLFYLLFPVFHPLSLLFSVLLWFLSQQLNVIILSMIMEGSGCYLYADVSFILSSAKTSKCFAQVFFIPPPPPFYLLVFGDDS